MAGKKGEATRPQILHENHILVQVPTGTSLKKIEEEIHKALAEEPQDFLRHSPSGQIIIVIQDEGDRFPPPPKKH